MLTSNRPAWILASALALASTTASAAGFVSGGGLGTPSALPVVEEGGYRTPPAQPALGGTFLTPAATGATDGIAYVQAGLRAAAQAAKCAPTAFEVRLRRRVHRLVNLVGSVPQASPAVRQSRLIRAASLLRGYCATVQAADFLESSCAEQLLVPCPNLATAAID